MRPLSSVFFLFVSSLAFVGAGEEKSDLDRMQGVWHVISLTEEGKAAPAAETEVLEVTIGKDEFTVTSKGKAVLRHRILLDPRKNPKAIDFTYLGGDNKGKTELGIYAFENDQLKLVLDEKKNERPTAFEGPTTATCSVMVLKRKEAK